MTWQRELADVAFEYDPATGSYRYNEVDVTVPRQSGKTTLVLAKSVYRCTATARVLGPQRTTYTAQNRLKARHKLERDFAELLRASRAFREIENPKARPSKASEWRLSLNNGSEHMQFGSGSFFQIDTPSRTGGHGDTLDDGTIDEAFAHKDSTVESGMRPTMGTRRNAQIWVISTAGDKDSRYLYRKVLSGRTASEAGDHGKVCYVEYSAPDDADPGDPTVWRTCMPALGNTIPEEFIAAEWERLQRERKVDEFRRAYLNQWPEVPLLDDFDGDLPYDHWKALADPSAERGRTPVFGVAAAPDQSWAAVAVAWVRPDGAVQVMLVDGGYRQGTAWLPDRVAELRSRWGGRVRAAASAKGIVPDAEQVKPGEQPVADNALVRRLDAGTLRHGNDAALNTAVRAARWRTSGDTRVLDQKGSADISPLIAASVAVQGVTAAPVTSGWMVGV